MSSDQAPFEYAGGEFENDAPYIEEDGQEGSGGGGGLESLLADLMGSGSFDDEDPDTCFSINAGASFAAIYQPEEQLAELELTTLDVETLCNVVDVVTPVEIMQVALLLQFMALHPAHPALSAQLQAIPTFLAAPAPAETSVSFEWFVHNEKMLMQALSLLGISLNRESALPASSSSSASSPSSSPAPVLYSLLFHGSKVTTQATVDGILHDLFQLLGLPDVLDRDTLAKQLIREMGAHACTHVAKVEIERTASSSAAAASASASASAPDAASPTPLASSLRAKFAQPLVGEAATDANATSSFVLDLDSPQPTLSVPRLPLAELRRRHGCRTELPGELDTALFASHFTHCHSAVWAAVNDKLSAAYPTDATKDFAPSALPFDRTPLGRFLLALTPQSPLALLLSPDTQDASNPAAFFTHFVAAAMQVQASKR